MAVAAMASPGSPKLDGASPHGLRGGEAGAAAAVMITGAATRLRRCHVP